MIADLSDSTSQLVTEIELMRQQVLAYAGAVACMASGADQAIALTSAIAAVQAEIQRRAPKGLDLLRAWHFRQPDYRNRARLQNLITECLGRL